MIILLVCIFFIYALSLNGNSDKTYYTLTSEQQRNIVKQVGLNGYKNVIKNRCLDVLAEKINTGKWSDSWCAGKYKHLDLK